MRLASVIAGRRSQWALSLIGKSGELP